MKRLFQGLYLTPYFLVFVLVFSYLQSIQVRLLFGHELNFYFFAPDGAIGNFLDAILLFLIIGNVLKAFQKQNTALSFTTGLKGFVLALIIYMVAINLLALSVSLIFGTFDRNFNQEVFVSNNIRYFLDTFIYGGFFMAHYYYQNYKSAQYTLAEYNRSVFESRLAQLKAQLNPHFLFNNLNVLDQLINEDQDKASGFLSDFAEVYRYVLQTSEKKLVSIESELEFAKSYYRLMKQKYGDSYILNIEGTPLPDSKVPPLTLQLLLENAIEHNLGTSSRPVIIKLQLNNEYIRITNNRMPKRNIKAGGGRALRNLESQFKLLTGNSIHVEKNSEEFSVSFPQIIHSK